LKEPPLSPPLAESKLVIIKGENKNRLVPDPNWFYYIWPLNWFGHKPDKDSIAFESDEMLLGDEFALYSIITGIIQYY